MDLITPGSGALTTPAAAPAGATGGDAADETGAEGDISSNIQCRFCFHRQNLAVHPNSHLALARIVQHLHIVCMALKSDTVVLHQPILARGFMPNRR